MDDDDINQRDCAPCKLIAMADTATEMKPVKHAFAAGTAAQAGIEW
jgi:cob(I)alamin adenosyltransferase